MEIKDKLTTLAQRAEKLMGQIRTEEATKQSLILPFFQILGYDVFNPLEFCPEFDADYGVKKGEKVDYAIIIDDEPVILIEAKLCTQSLDKHGSQLFRYFTTTKAKFGVLTNGIKYRFFTDLDEANKMDESPFFEIDLLNLTDLSISYLKNFQLEKLDVDSIMSTASELKYSNLIKDFLKDQLKNTSEDFANYLLGKVYEGRRTNSVVEKFIPVVNSSFNQFINETLSNKFEATLKGSLNAPVINPVQIIENTVGLEVASESEVITKIVTTTEELEAFAIIKSILRQVVDPSKITFKDTETYFGILFENNTRKWICRIYLGTKKSIVLPTSSKSQERIYIETLDDLFNLSEQLVEVVTRFIQ